MRRHWKRNQSPSCSVDKHQKEKVVEYLPSRLTERDRLADKRPVVSSAVSQLRAREGTSVKLDPDLVFLGWKEKAFIITPKADLSTKKIKR